MTTLRIDESVQDRVNEFYDEMVKAKYIQDNKVYSLMSIHQANMVKMFQISKTIKCLHFIDHKNVRQVENFTNHLKLSFFLAGDIVIKEGNNNENFFYIHNGMAEVLLQNRDFSFFQFKNVQAFIENNEELPDPNDEKENEEEDQDFDNQFEAK